jgi:hypothetical protein
MENVQHYIIVDIVDPVVEVLTRHAPIITVDGVVV